MIRLDALTPVQIMTTLEARGLKCEALEQAGGTPLCQERCRPDRIWLN